MNQSEDFKYSMLFEKIKNLESSLKKTQENETKLLEIIEKMIQKLGPSNAVHLTHLIVSKDILEM